MTNEPARESQAEPPAAREQRPDVPGVWWRDGERYVVLATLNGTLVVTPLADDGRIGPWHTPVIEVPQSLSDGWSRAVPVSELADLKAKLEEAERELADVMRGMDAVRDAARSRNPSGATILDFMACWNEQYEDKIRKLTAEVEKLNGLLAKREADRAAGWPELPTFSGKAKRKSDGAKVLFRTRQTIVAVVEPDGFISLRGHGNFAEQFEVIQPEEAGE